MQECNFSETSIVLGSIIKLFFKQYRPMVHQALLSWTLFNSSFCQILQNKIQQNPYSIEVLFLKFTFFNFPIFNYYNFYALAYTYKDWLSLHPPFLPASTCQPPPPNFALTSCATNRTSKP